MTPAEVGYCWTTIYYGWLKVGNIEIEVGDIKSDEDETAIMQQIYAMGMKWA